MAARKENIEIGRGEALADVAKAIVSAGLTIGSVMLTAFGFLERAVGLERLATDRRFALVALLPGTAALAYLASARALGAAYDASVPPRPISALRRAALRFSDLSGAFGLFGIIISGLVAVGTVFAFALLFDLALFGVSLLAGAAAFTIALSGMLSRSSPGRRRLDLALIVTIIVAMLTDLVLSFQNIKLFAIPVP